MALFFILANRESALDSCRWKTLEFLSFQISQRMSMVSVRIALRGMAGVVVMLFHHSKVVLLGLQFEGRKPGCAVQVVIRSQMRHVFRHSDVR